MFLCCVGVKFGLGRLIVPTGRDGGCWRVVERRVDFNRVEVCGVVSEEVAGLHALGIVGSDPPFGCESRRADPKFGHGGKILRDWSAPGPCEAIKGSHFEIAGAKRISRHLSGRNVLALLCDSSFCEGDAIIGFTMR
jgi:hypothetical protein